MKLTRWKKADSDVGSSSWPQSLRRFRSEIDGLFDRFFDDPIKAFDRAMSSFHGWAPSVDVLDGEKEVTIRAEVAGVDPKDVEITVSGRTLFLAGEKKSESEEKRRGQYRSECSYGAFRRAIELPEGVDPDRITAESVNGVLTVRVPKSKPTPVKRISVSSK